MTSKDLDSLLRDAIEHAKTASAGPRCTVDGVVQPDAAVAKAPADRAECEILPRCGFFKKYHAVKDLACRGFIRLYCRGPKMDECKRKEYFRKHGGPPSDDMMPSGQPIVMNYRAPDWMAILGVEGSTPAEIPSETQDKTS